MLGPFATESRRTPIHQVSLPVLSHAACASLSTTTTTTRDRGDCYGPMEWAQQLGNMQDKYKQSAVWQYLPAAEHKLNWHTERATQMAQTWRQRHL